MRQLLRYGMPVCDPIARAQWGVPAGEAMVIDEADFREGNQDRYRCGPPGSLDFHELRSTTGSFHNVSLCIQKLSQRAAKPCYLLVTWAFEPNGSTTYVDDHDSTCFLRRVWHDQKEAVAVTPRHWNNCKSCGEKVHEVFS